MHGCEGLDFWVELLFYTPYGMRVNIALVQGVNAATVLQIVHQFSYSAMSRARDVK